MTNRLLSQVKLPYAYTRGSIHERSANAGKLVCEFYKTIKGRFKNGELTLKELQECVNDVLPGEGTLKVIAKTCNEADYEGRSDVLYSSMSGKTTATTMEVTPSKNGKYTTKDISTIVHEFQHVADQIYNPKYLARSQYMTNEGLYSDKYNNLYDYHLYNKEDPESKSDKNYILNRIKRIIQKFLRGESTEDKINYLQDMRYALIMEDNAYNTQFKYAKKLKKQHSKVNYLDLIKFNKEYMFKEKIELLKSLAGEIIKAERGKHAARLKKEKLRNVKKSRKNGN